MHVAIRKIVTKMLINRQLHQITLGADYFLKNQNSK